MKSVRVCMSSVRACAGRARVGEGGQCVVSELGWFVGHSLG